MNTNDYLALNFKDIKDYSDLYPQSRRDFLKRLGGGIIIFVAMSEFLAAQAQEARRRRRPAAACLPISTPSCGLARMAA